MKQSIHYPKTYGQQQGLLILDITKIMILERRKVLKILAICSFFSEQYFSSTSNYQFGSRQFFGIFIYYDYSEFIAYSLLLLIILYFYWDSIKGNPNTMINSKVKNAFWNNLIQDFKEKNIIANGLTIPYLVGAMTLKYKLSPSKETLIELINNLINSNSTNKPVLQFCDDINEYVISLKTEEFCETNFKTEYFFRNVANAKTLFVAQNASQFGKTKEELINSLWEKYGEQIQHKLFSWKSLKQQWFPFGLLDENRIKEALR